jgi:hypothetical protein
MARAPRKAEAPEAAPQADLPKAVRLTHPYAYFTDTNVLRAWDVDHVETDADEIATLIERGAPVVEHQD